MIDQNYELEVSSPGVFRSLTKPKHFEKYLGEKIKVKIKSKILDKNVVTTEIGKAKLQWNEIPLSEKLDTKNLNIGITDLNNKEHFGGTAVNVGNPHIVFFVNEIENFNIEKIGPEIENHKIFPEKCNVTIATIINKNLIKVKVWERGAGLTKACGTAACATAFAGKLNDLTENKTDIEFTNR